MGIEGSHVGDVRGSIGGCAATIALLRVGCEVTAFERSSDRLRACGFADADGATIVTDSRHRHRNDLMAGADGYRSDTRRLVDRGIGPDYVGYVLWRGGYAENATRVRVRDAEGARGYALGTIFDGT
jgi:hypothetical protein